MMGAQRSPLRIHKFASRWLAFLKLVEVFFSSLIYCGDRKFEVSKQVNHYLLSSYFVHLTFCFHWTTQLAPYTHTL